MAVSQSSVIDRWEGGGHSRSAVSLGRVAGISGLAAIAVMAVVAAVEPSEPEEALAARVAQAAGTGGFASDVLKPTRSFGGYGGVAHTLPTEVVITEADGNRITASGFDWIGKPFEAPIYYGLRVQRWPATGVFGTMLDFTHAKAIAKRNSEATFTGTRNGEALPKTAKIGDVLRKLEFSHGHNMLTYNGLVRFGALFGRFRPYFGAGAGISLPHTEIGFTGEKERTYEYQFAGFAGQGLGGIEIDLGRTSLFVEYKFTYAPYDVPLSEVSPGWLLVTDLWRQFRAWWSGEVPPGGRLTVTLVSHHGIAGVMVKAGRWK